MKSFVALFLGLVVVSASVAGDFGDRLGRRALRRCRGNDCAGCVSNTKVVEETPAVIRKESIYQTKKVGEKITIVPAETTKKNSK